MPRKCANCGNYSYKHSQLWQKQANKDVHSSAHSLQPTWPNGIWGLTIQRQEGSCCKRRTLFQLCEAAPHDGQVVYIQRLGGWCLGSGGEE